MYNLQTHALGKYAKHCLKEFDLFYYVQKIKTCDKAEEEASGNLQTPVVNRLGFPCFTAKFQFKFLHAHTISNAIRTIRNHILKLALKHSIFPELYIKSTFIKLIKLKLLI